MVHFPFPAMFDYRRVWDISPSWNGNMMEQSIININHDSDLWWHRRVVLATKNHWMPGPGIIRKLRSSCWRPNSEATKLRGFRHVFSMGLVVLDGWYWVSYNDLTTTETHRWWWVRWIIPFYGRTLQVSEILQVAQMRLSAETVIIVIFFGFSGS